MPRNKKKRTSASELSSDVQHFGALNHDLNLMKQVESYISVGIDRTLDVANDVKKCSEGRDGLCERTLKEVMRDYVQMERDFKQFIDSFEYAQGLVIESTDKANLQGILDNYLDELTKANDDGQFESHTKYVALLEKLEANSPALELSTNDESLGISEVDDADIEMTQGYVVTKCPYTRQEMKCPVKNKICGHSYERDGILDYISKRKHKARCPVGGCHNDHVLKIENLEDNRILRHFIERKCH